MATDSTEGELPSSESIRMRMTALLLRGKQQLEIDAWTRPLADEVKTVIRVNN